MNALVPLPRAATPLSLTRGGKTATALRLAELNDATNLDFRLQDRSGYHPSHALAIREIRFDRARLIDGMERGRLWRGLKTDEARACFYGSPGFDAPCVPLAETVRHRGFLIGRVLEAPLTVYNWATNIWQRVIWLAFCSHGERIGTYMSRGEALAALYHRFGEECETVEQLWRNDPSRRRFAQRGAHDGYELLDDDEIIADSEPDLYDEEALTVVPKPLPSEKPIAGPSVRRLSRGEERELSAAAKAGDFRARERLAAEALAAAHFVVLRFKKSFLDIPYHDLVGAAQPAILRSLGSFDPRSGMLKTLVDKAVARDLGKYCKRRAKLAKRELPISDGDYYDDEGDDDRNRFDDAAAELAWKAATFDADELSDLSGLLAHLEAGIGKDVVTALLGGDLTQKEVAAQLGLSEATISRALASAYAKLRSLADVPAAADPEKADAAVSRHVLATRAKYPPLGVSEEELLEEAETRTRSRTAAMPPDP